jgi:DNA-binding response OmpR family regulator
MPQAILLVEDENFTRELVSVTLQGAGYRVIAVADGESAVRELDRQYPDLAILDVRLPGMDGWELCQQLRTRADVPVIFLTSLRDDEYVVKGLRAGGDDYLVKPFSPLVLVAHVEAVLRRSTGGPAAEPVRLPGLAIDLVKQTVQRDGQGVHLTATELRILLALARRRGQTLSARQLLSDANDYHVTEREARPIVKVHVRNLRQKIEEEPDAPRHVLTVRGLGYMLAPDAVASTA